MEGNKKMSIRGNRTITSLVDFVIQAAEGKEFRILQLTDTQIIDPGQSRYPERINNVTPISDEQLYTDCFHYIKSTIEKTKPNLILMTGDNIYGEFDDSGASLNKLITYMESFQIPWAPVWGNHDNESIKGVAWQCQQFEKAQHCLFKRGNVTGNSNYTIGIEQGGKLIKVIFMMDSNGCGNGKSYSYLPSFGEYNRDEKLKTQMGFGEDQIQWVDRTCQHIAEVLGYIPSKFAAFHIPIIEYWHAASAKGYPVGDGSVKFVIDDPTGTDFGQKQDLFGILEAPGFWELLKKYSFDGVFAGHYHANNFSILYDGIRLTHGMKSSRFGNYLQDMLGGTLITLDRKRTSFGVEHIYIKNIRNVEENEEIYQQHFNTGSVEPMPTYRLW